MANELTTQAPPKSVLITVADRYGMEPQAFEQTLRNTVVPANCTREQFAAFLVVANEYGLNPLTKEIYAFPTRGGIQPIVSIDGWINLANKHPQMDGVEFEEQIEGGNLISVTCRIARKDRKMPIVITEYLEECKMPTDPWKRFPRRMLRHKAFIQAARYAFGFSGIVDDDEFGRMGGPASPSAGPVQRMSPGEALSEFGKPPLIEHHDEITGEIIDGSTVVDGDKQQQSPPADQPEPERRKPGRPAGSTKAATEAAKQATSASDPKPATDGSVQEKRTEAPQEAQQSVSDQIANDPGIDHDADRGEGEDLSMLDAGDDGEPQMPAEPTKADDYPAYIRAKIKIAETKGADWLKSEVYREGTGNPDQNGLRAKLGFGGTPLTALLGEVQKALGALRAKGKN